MILRKVNGRAFRICYTFNNLFNPWDIIGYSGIHTVFSFFSTALTPAYNPQEKPSVVVGHSERATAVPFAGICGLSVVPRAEHVVGNESVRWLLTGLHVYDGQPHFHEEAQCGTSVVSGTPPAHHPYTPLFWEQGGKGRAWKADGNYVLVKNNIAAQVQQGNVTIVVIWIVMGMRPAPFHINLLFFEFSLVFVKVSCSHKLEC